MRVPTNALPNSLVVQLRQLTEKQNRLQTQAATGQRLQWADDDPAAMERALGLQTGRRANDQYTKNIDFLKERTTASVSSIRSLNKILDRANELAVLADGTKSPAQLRDYAGEVDQLIRQAVQTGNVKHRSDYIFGGTKSDRPPFVVTENADGKVGKVDFNGNSDVPELEIAEGSKIPMQISGVNASGTGSSGLFSDSRAGTDVFAHLIAFRDHLAAGDVGAVASTDRPGLVQDEDNVLYGLASVGASQARLESASSAVRNRSSELRQSLTEATGADMAQTLVQLSATQTAYRAALQSGANLLGVSLMDYLR